jgi:peroxiredoxin
VNTDQVLALPAPAKLTLDDVYADAVLAQYLTSGMAGASVQLLLLLDDKPLEKILEGAEAPQLVEPKPLEDRLCYRVRAKRGDGDLVLWIDQKSYELRRIDFPIDELKKQFAEQAEVKQLAVWADFAGARLNAKIDDKAFQIELPPEAKLVKKFDQRSFNPPPPPPSPLLGKAAPEFSLKDLEGNAVSVKDLEGQVAVLDFWFTTCPPCRETLPNLEKVYQRYKDHPKVRFLAVSVDPADIPAANLKQMFTDLRLNIPIARDDEQKAAQALGIEGYPTLMVLGSDGTVQHHETGVNPELAAALPAKLEKLIAGQSVFEETLREYQARKAEYDQANKEPEVPKAEIAAKSEPQKLKLAQLWNCKELKQPGNILVISEQGKTRLLVHDGWDAVAELGADGKLVARHDLKLGQDDVVSYLRTAVDAKGRRYYLGLANSRPQVFLFDDKFQRLLAYPEDRDHAGIADALLVDLDGEGLKMAVSYWGQVGVQWSTCSVYRRRGPMPRDTAAWRAFTARGRWCWSITRAARASPSPWERVSCGTSPATISTAMASLSTWPSRPTTPASNLPWGSPSPAASFGRTAFPAACSHTRSRWSLPADWPAASGSGLSPGPMAPFTSSRPKGSQWTASTTARPSRASPSRSWRASGRCWSPRHKASMRGL